ncbi:MAG: hypothetical protein IJS90_01280 [Clostridia bacterium]|nr:hypothetical protein [Clostridia bacterium]
MKKIIALFLCAALFFGVAVPAFGANTGARLYNVYGDDMLFQRNADAVLAGEAPSGGNILAELYDKNGELTAYGKSVASDGAFTVSFPAPSGGYDTYTVKVSCNGSVFAELKNIVFGELWLAVGQSNMEYYLSMTPEGKDMIAKGETGPHDLHVLHVRPPYADGAYQTRAKPQTDAVNCSWFPGDDAQVYNMSAPAYFFALKLMEFLDMPVGVLSAPLGGSCISPWLSRAAIDGSEKVKSHIVNDGRYRDEDFWNTSDCSITVDMTNLYNTNIAPLLNFRPQGAIWYQGCSDLILDHSAEYYFDCFELMQDSYTADFNYTRGRMPFIFTQIACYDYGRGPFSVTEFNEVFTDLAKADPSSRGEVTIYDLPLDYNEMGYIHPMTKKPVGERMFSLAESLVYGKKSPSSAPYCINEEVSGGSVYLTFASFGGKLGFVGGTPRGFAVCGSDGTAVEASAEIVSNDTVRVYSEYVKEPVAATYAAGSWSERANLWSYYGGEPFMPAAPYGIRDAAVKHRYADNSWMDCEDMTTFKSGDDAGYIETWKYSGCSVCLESNDFTEGDGSLRITSLLPFFTLSPNISYIDDNKLEVFDNIDSNWSDYGVLSLKLKNCGEKPVRLTELRLYTGMLTYYTPVCAETGLKGLSVPADGEWHTYTFDLGRLFLAGAAAVENTGGKLGEIKNIRFTFEGACAELLLDEIRPLPSENGENGKTGVFESILSYIKALFKAFTDRIFSIFNFNAQ